MKFAVRHAFINVVRMPVRTALCFLIIFAVTAVSAVCIRLNKLTESARERFADEYPAVATVSVRVTTSPDGVRSYASKRLYLDDAAMLARSDTVRSYGISIFAGKLGVAFSHRILRRLYTQAALPSCMPLPICLLQNSSSAGTAK